jgi:hypothetical protein
LLSVALRPATDALPWEVDFGCRLCLLARGCFALPVAAFLPRLAALAALVDLDLLAPFADERLDFAFAVERLRLVPRFDVPRALAADIPHLRSVGPCVRRSWVRRTQVLEAGLPGLGPSKSHRRMLMPVAVNVSEGA